ncbi:MAG: hypothetical protein LPK02_15840 [Rhodobacterales bacterium]|nr:hypothetical protein [Rhodobacterales bacterium]MDX5414507.1 hypothetical protein [Rhodobacterales bacterium]
MSDATMDNVIARATAPRHAAQTLRLGPTLWVALAAVVAMSLPNMADPMIRHDDFPALLADGDLFWNKTLHEGRWINYFWHLRGIVTPSWLNFAVYQLLWAVFAAATATVVTRNRGAGFFTLVLAIFILVSPSAMIISLWFNTLTPGLALVALFAVLACRVSDRTLTALLPVFVILTFMAYTTYPLLLLAVYLFRQDQRSLARLIGILALFTASFIAAVLLTYTLNWLVHGVFGVPLDDWREATPAADVAGMIANLPRLWSVMSGFAVRTSFNFEPAVAFHLALFAGATLVLLRRAPLEALYLHAGLITGLTLVTAQVLKMGVTVPPRAFIFAWVFYGIAVVRADQILSENATGRGQFSPGLPGRLARNAVVLIAASYLLQGSILSSLFRPWQAETRELAQTLATLPEPILIVGHPAQIATARDAGIQSDKAVPFRLRQLIGRDAILCSEASPPCDLPAPSANSRTITTQSGVTIRAEPTGTVVDFTPAFVPEQTTP